MRSLQATRQVFLHNMCAVRVKKHFVVNFRKKKSNSRLRRMWSVNDKAESSKRNKKKKSGSSEKRFFKRET